MNGITQMLSAAAAKYGLDSGLVLSLARRESGLNPNAVSPKGAKGVMQLTDATAMALGVTNPFDPAQNIDAGVRYLRQLISQFGDIVKGVAAYNWGPGRVSEAIARYGDDWLGAAPAETRDYVEAIVGITAPLTIDSTTGKPIESNVNVETLPYAGSTSRQGPAVLSTQQLLILTAVGLGAYFLADLLRE